MVRFDQKCFLLDIPHSFKWLLYPSTCIQINKISSPQYALSSASWPMTEENAYISVSQKLSLASDIVSDAVQVHIGHFSSYIGHINHKMIINSHWTSDIMSDVFFTYIGHSGGNVGHVRRFLGYTAILF